MNLSDGKGRKTVCKDKRKILVTIFQLAIIRIFVTEPLLLLLLLGCLLLPFYLRMSDAQNGRNVSLNS